MLKRIITKDVEPAELDVRFAPRLTLLAGDNGLGKTFVLDLAWWALTATWARRPAIPRRGEGVGPTIRCEIEDTRGDAPVRGEFDFGDQKWDRTNERTQRYSDAVGRPVPRLEREDLRLVISAQPDGGFEVWDSLRSSGPWRLPLGNVAWGVSRRFSLDALKVWEGLHAEDGTTLCNGLIRDWVAWQFQKPQLFELFTRVLAKLSPSPEETIRPGSPQRVSIQEARDIPTILLPYGEVPVTHASAGMRRVLAIAYVLVWTWHEHAEAARLMNTKPLDELVLLIDEIDAHLHPKWQRVILPALFDVFREIEPSLRVQVLVSTHAPLVLASVETLFDEERDELLHFAFRDGAIHVDDVPWAKQGDAVNWLVSEAFGLHQGRSREAERTIEAAEALLRGDPTPPELSTREAIQAELLRTLGGHDDFWPRWLVGTGVVRVIPVPRVPEPDDFAERARVPGNAWLAAHPDADRPRDFWSPFREALAEGFQRRCGYAAMLVPDGGTVDHFQSCKTHPELTYEWTNLRFASAGINSTKKNYAVLDPHDVGEGWFEVQLPDLQLVMTDRIPPDVCELAALTLERLRLVNDPRIIKWRRAWYEMYRQENLSLEGLRRVAPLVAAAVLKAGA